MDMSTMLELPRAEVRPLAPRTLVWAAGGTRRQAAIEGVPLDAAYYDWAWQQHLDRAALFFDLGVRTLFTPILGPPQVREVGRYRDALFQALRLVGGAKSLAAYRQMGVRVRFYGQQRIPGLAEVCAAVERETAGAGPATLWWSFVVERNDEALWDAVQAAMRVGASSLEEAVQAFYGEPVDPVDVFVGFGKLQAGYLMPPLLGEQADLYWTAFPSYMLTEAHIRSIFWDHRFARATWSADKTNRYDEVGDGEIARRYQEQTIVGLGRQVGRFWHPQLPGEK